MKRFALALILLASLSAAAQMDNTLYVKQFPGVDVGSKVTAAMASCTTNPLIQCALVIDASLAVYAPGTMPTLCSHCYLLDLRHGAAGYEVGTGVYLVKSYYTTDAGVAIAACLTALPGGAGTCDTRGLGAGIFVTSQFTLGAGQTLICDAAQEFQPATASETVVVVKGGATIDGCHFDVTNQASFSGSVLSFTDTYGSAGINGNGQTTIKHCKFTGYPVLTGNAIYVASTNAATQSVYTLNFDDLTIDGFGYGFNMNVSGSGFINGVTWNGVKVIYTPVGWDLSSANTGAVIAQDQIVNSSYQALGHAGHAIQVDGTGQIQANLFMLTSFDTSVPIVFNNTAASLGNTFIGNFDGTITDTTGLNTYIDLAQFAEQMTLGSLVPLNVPFKAVFGASQTTGLDFDNQLAVYGTPVWPPHLGNSAQLGWGLDPNQGDADLMCNSNQGPTFACIEFWGPNTGNTAQQSLGKILNSGTWVAPALIVSALGGSGTQCAQVDNTGHFSGTGLACGTGGSSVAIETNSVNNSTQTTLNLETSSANTDGLTITPSNPSGGIEKLEITGTYIGSIATQLASPPHIGGTTPAEVDSTFLTQSACATATTITVPCLITSAVVPSQTAATGATSTVFTTSTAGLYRVIGTCYATTASTSAWVAYSFVSTTQTGMANSPWLPPIGSCTVGTTAGFNTANTTQLLNLASGVAVKIGTQTTSGSNTGGVFTYAYTIERLN